jgi:hypothetical protein
MPPRRWPLRTLIVLRADRPYKNRPDRIIMPFVIYNITKNVSLIPHQVAQVGELTLCSLGCPQREHNRQDMSYDPAHPDHHQN